ncbi:MAG: hypothetical protein Q7J40_02720 [Atribacterota bacterium]|nr:hypothetical protein [Atribacterota bacterium]
MLYYILSFLSPLFLKLLDFKYLGSYTLIFSSFISDSKRTVPLTSYFYLSRGEEKEKRRERGRKIKRGRTKKEQYSHRANSNLPGESIARERERVLLFINRGKSPLFYKKQYQK